ncbi:MAG: biopolymer transporter ExbD [Kiritimatiellae bacterium]|nr:biopolymer transporter ExbD [Kiritimatiellia bacterium]
MSPASIEPPSLAFERIFPQRRRELQGPMSLVSFLNIAFLLVLLVWTHAPFIRPAGVRIDLPVSDAVESLPFDALVVTVSQEGMVFFGDQRTTMEGLQSLLQQAAREREHPPMIVDADARVSHRTLVEIYSMASRAGIEKVLLATRPPPETTDATPASADAQPLEGTP